MSFGMAERQQLRAHEDKEPEHHNDVKGTTANDEYDDFRLSTSSIPELDRKDLLIVKDGTVRVAESLDREQQQLDANGEVVKASGTWTKIEHERFLRAMETFPKGPWKAIAEMVGTRTVRQTQTHAQKYREKMARRMRGLRNRNGTLQSPPMSAGITAPGVLRYSQPTVSPYVNVHTRVYHHSPHPGAMGFMTPVPTHLVSAPMAATPLGLARTTSLPAMPMSNSLQHPYLSSAMATSVAMATAEFNNLSTSTISSAFIGNANYPSSWETNAVKETVPDFDESMDFLMDVYSTNPNQINSSAPPASSTMTVTPTACIPRTPQTPTLSLATKRHPGYGFVQEPQTKHVRHLSHEHNSVN
ncbi:hypothetical protein KRP22_007727 [Phytophthora ramorum]|nr:Myb-like protein J [Phytophthora ramorum]